MEILIKHMKLQKALYILWDSKKDPWLLDVPCHIAIQIIDDMLCLRDESMPLLTQPSTMHQMWHVLLRTSLM